MWTLICIGIVGIMSYNCMENSRNFNGSSEAIKLYTTFFALLGTPLYYGLIIWSFWHYDWWMPIVTYIIAIILGGITAPLFQHTIFGILFSPIIMVTFAIISIINLL